MGAFTLSGGSIGPARNAGSFSLPRLNESAVTRDAISYNSPEIFGDAAELPPGRHSKTGFYVRVNPESYNRVVCHYLILVVTTGEHWFSIKEQIEYGKHSLPQVSSYIVDVSRICGDYLCANLCESDQITF